jgi:hypothetical protein
MSIEFNDKKEIKLLTDVFSSPQDAFEGYIRDPNFSRASIFRIHISLFLFAPIFKLIHNLFFTFVASRYFGLEAPAKLTEGLTTSFVIYPTILFLIYHLDILLLKLKVGEASMDAIEERDLLLISFIPLSASCMFWLFPKPFNFFLILGAVFYSFYLSKMALRTLLGFTGKQFLVFISYAIILCTTLSAVALTVFNLVRK